jgi:hypothetical protein
MTNRLLISFTAAALIAGTSLVQAQTIGGNATDGAASGPGGSTTPHPVNEPSPLSAASSNINGDSVPNGRTYGTSSHPFRRNPAEVRR